MHALKKVFKKSFRSRKCLWMKPAVGLFLDHYSDLTPIIDEKISKPPQKLDSWKWNKLLNHFSV